ncbi:ice-binding family protein [Lacinutrix sp. Bg11-31]|uniref:ice-binding family protein n=1 Tax=Lacinutrix sp. Bg11-31 TaxID=2057808 RepID=UPI000C30B95A|nr:ice-binding family protein [Lacinutrix sp. Bg11-31]AUC83542.1 hypothetical protein CW733_15970 [Lacinutrix sp. Bg11-31]
MKFILKCFVVQLFLLPLGSIYAQVGIGTTTPDTSSILDVSSSSKGLLMPRLTTTERDNITLPATGLIIFNTTLVDGQLNTGSPSSPNWIGIKRYEGSMIDSAISGDIISTTSTTAMLVPGMTKALEIGTYSVSFNGQHLTSAVNQEFNTSEGIIDIDLIYQDLITLTATNTSHSLVFGNGEHLAPGVYDIVGSTSVAGTLTLNGGGDPNSVFIIRSTGPLTTGVGTSVILTNGASANNVFWVSELPMSTGANSIFKGSLVSRAGAISLGVSTSMEGRVFTKSGALSVGASCILTEPSGVSPIDLRRLSSFVMFTTSGAVSSDVSSTISGDIGTGIGALAIAGVHYGELYPAGTTSTSETTTTYSIYQNGTELVNSSRKITSLNSVVSLQAKVTALTAGEVIEIRWKVSSGQATLDNRDLLFIRSE